MAAVANLCLANRICSLANWEVENETRPPAWQAAPEKAPLARLPREDRGCRLLDAARNHDRVRTHHADLGLAILGRPQESDVLGDDQIIAAVGLEQNELHGRTFQGLRRRS